MAAEPALKTTDDKPTNLRELKEGDRATIIEVGGAGPFRRRLLEMGFLPGTVVLIKKYAPLNDPIEFVLKGYHVSLRREEAENVLVELIAPEPGGGSSRRPRGLRWLHRQPKV
jgi:ferrous iron transport protein A